MGTEFRHEYKYLCTYSQLVLLRKRLESLLARDIHAGPQGTYLIRSVYFDDPNDSCYYENEDGVDPRSKYRLRIYNCSNQRITLERKAKCRGMTHKDTCIVTKEQCRILLSGKIPPLDQKMPTLLVRMLTQMRLKAMQPVVIVQYERTPFINPAGNVRVTLDQRICSSQAFDRFFEQEIPLRQILPTGHGILETKWDQFFPSYLYDHLQLEDMQWISFSKYYLCRKYNSHGGIVL